MLRPRKSPSPFFPPSLQQTPGGVRIGGYPKAAPVAGPLGWQRPGDWDFLWAPARLALKAIPHLKPGQLVSACPGLMSITKKVWRGGSGG